MMSMMRLKPGIIGRSAALGPTPSVAAIGAVSSGATATLTPGFPTGIVAGSLLILHAESSNIAADITTDLALDGWSEVYDDQRSSGAGNAIRQWVYYKYATGSESGSLTVTWAASANRIARITRIANARPSAPFEGPTLVVGTDDPITGPSLAPSGANRLGLALIAVGDNQAASNVLASATGGTWAGHYGNVEGAGNDTALFLNSVDLSAGGSISGGNFSPGMVAAADWLLRGTLLKPTGA